MRFWNTILPKQQRILISLLAVALALLFLVPMWLIHTPSASAQGAACLSGTVTTTSSWVTYWSTATVSYGQPVTVGSVIVACDPDGVKAGVFTVTAAGEYGPLYVYGDDSTTPGTEEGAEAGDHITFYVNGKKAAPQGPDDPAGGRDNAVGNEDLVCPGGVGCDVSEG